MPTPDLAPLIPDFLLARDSENDCKLPCWQGLRIGVSKRSDIQAWFDITLQFGGSIDVFQNERLEQWEIEFYKLDIPGTDFGGYWWDLLPPIEGADYFALYFLVDEQTSVLRAIRFQNAPHTGGYATFTPQDVINKLGAPSAIQLQTANGGGVLIMLVYNDGIVVTSFIEAGEQRREEDGEEIDYIHYCLNQQGRSTISFLTEPIQPEALTAIQSEWFGDELANMPDIEAYGLSVNELTAIAASDNPCFDLGYLD
jgi:hypothetical protein